MIRTKGEAGTGDVVEAVRHIRTLHKDMSSLHRTAYLLHSAGDADGANDG